MFRRLKIGATIGQSIAQTNGCLQGCSISLIAVSVLASTWVKELREKVAGISPICYIDDRSWVIGDIEQQHNAMQVTQEYDEATGQIQNLSLIHI